MQEKSSKWINRMNNAKLWTWVWCLGKNEPLWNKRQETGLTILFFFVMTWQLAKFFKSSWWLFRKSVYINILQNRYADIYANKPTAITLTDNIFQFENENVYVLTPTTDVY